MTAHDLLQTAELACREAGTAVLALRAGTGRSMSVRGKSGPHDLVTEGDLLAERLIAGLIRDRHPESRILAEEGTTGEEGSGLLRWFVDSIDGTSNFVSGLPMFCVSVGVEFDGTLVAGCVHDPVREETYGACDGMLFLNGEALPVQPRRSLARTLLTDFPHDGGLPGPAELELFAGLVRDHSVRRIGSSALALAYVAAGKADLAFNIGVAPWDVAGGACLVDAAGGTFVGLDWAGVTGIRAAWEQPVFLAYRADDQNETDRLHETVAAYLQQSAAVRYERENAS